MDKALNLETNQSPTRSASDRKEAGEKTNVVVSRPPVSKGYRTQNPKAAGSPNNESEGDSENEDPSVIWRGLTQSDINNLKTGKGLVADTRKTGAALYGEIREHVENGSNPDHRCGLMSATRSKKVAARYSSHKVFGAPEPSRRLAKIKLDAATTSSIDLTESAERAKAGLAGKVEKFANNSQEVIICSAIPQENIMGVYSVKEFWLNKIKADGTESRGARQAEAEYQRAKQSGKDSSFVKFRAYERDAYYGFGIKAEKLSNYLPAGEQKETIEKDKISAIPATPGTKDPVKKEAEGSPESSPVSKALVKELEAVKLDLARVSPAKAEQGTETQSRTLQHQFPDLTKTDASLTAFATPEAVVFPESPVSLVSSPLRKKSREGIV